MQTLVDVVDVESGNLQWPGLTRKDHSFPTRATLQVLRLGRARFEDEVGIAVESSLIEP